MCLYCVGFANAVLVGGGSGVGRLGQSGKKKEEGGFVVLGLLGSVRKQAIIQQLIENRLYDT